MGLFGGVPGLDIEALPDELQFIGDSSCVASAKFTKGVLTVHFEEGQTYEYYGIHPFVWYNWLRSTSKGFYYNKRIRNAGYQYTRTG